MRFMEIANPKDQLALWRLISNSVWSELGKSPADPVNTSSDMQKPVVTPTMQPPRINPQPKYRPKKKTTIHKVPKPKRAPMAPAPKPLPKPKPLTPTPLQTKKAQTQQHQQLAQHVYHAFNKPNSYQKLQPQSKTPQQSPPNIEPKDQSTNPINNDYSNRDKDQLVFHRRQNPFKPINNLR